MGMSVSRNVVELYRLAVMWIYCHVQKSSEFMQIILCNLEQQDAPVPLVMKDTQGDITAVVSEKHGMPHIQMKKVIKCAFFESIFF